MTIKEIKQEVLYYGGKKISNAEAQEILDFVNDNPDKDLGEIIQAFLELE